MRSTTLAAAFVLLTACGEESPDPVPDAGTHIDGGDESGKKEGTPQDGTGGTGGTGNGCGGSCTDGGAPDGGSGKVSRAFITRAVWTGGLGGVAGADSKCQMAADA